MNEKARRFLSSIIECHVPTGDEQRLQRMLRAWAQPFADRVVPDEHGNLDVVIHPGAPLRVMLAGHCDRIGFMVMRIDASGFVKVDALGGVDEAVLPGSNVCIHGRQGGVAGVFGKTAVHNQAPEDKEKVTKLEDLWIDIGAASREEAEERVQIGDYATFRPRITELQGRRIAAPGLDNALGVWVVMETARRCAERGIEVELHCVSTVQEEIGSRGAETAAKAINPHIALAVDTTLGADDPGRPKKKTAPRIQLGAGPAIAYGPNTNVVVGDRLAQAARAAGIAHQWEPNSGLESNDAREVQVAGAGIAAGSIGIPIRNMHTQVEVADLNDAEAAARLLTEFVAALPRELSLLPIDAEHGRDEHQRAKPGPSGKPARASG